MKIAHLAHLALGDSLLPKQARFGFFQSRNSSVTGHRREIEEKFVEALSAFKVINERLEGHAGIAKHRFATKNLRVLYDNAVSAGHG